jgi:hypothetical protein
MDPFAVISIVSLLADFANERRAGATHSYEEFQAWLAENRHEEVIKALRQSAATVTSIKTILSVDRQALFDHLDRIDCNVAVIAESFEGFAELAAAVRPFARLSPDALNFLRNIDRSGTGRVLEARLLAAALPEFVPLDTYTQAGTQIKYAGDVRFYEDDIGMLLETGLLRLTRNESGRRIFIMTRQASDLVRADDAKRERGALPPG